MQGTTMTGDIQPEKAHLPELSKLVRGGGINFGGSIGSKGILFFLTLIFAKVLGPSDVGIYFLGTTICEFMAFTANLGLPAGMIRYVAIYNERNDQQRIKGTILGGAAFTFLAGTLAGAILFLSADFAAAFIFHKPALGYVLKVFSLSIPFECLMRTFTASTLGLKVMEHTAYIEHLAWVGLRLLLAVVFIFGFNMGLKGGVWAYTISSIICAGMACYYASDLIPLFRKQVTPVFENKELLTFSVPMVLSSMVNELMRNEDVLMLGYFVSAAEVGIYSIAVKILNFVEAVFQTFRPMFNPMVAELHEKEEFTKLSHLLKLITRWNITISCPIFLCILLFPEFSLSIFSKEFIGGAGCLRILALGSIIVSLSSYPDSLIFMSGRSHIVLINTFIALIVNFIVNYLLIPGYGITGAALGTLAAFLVVSLLSISAAYSLMKIHPLSTSLWKPIVAGCIPLFILFTINKWLSFRSNTITVSLMALFTLLYFIFIYWFGLGEDELYVMNKIREKIAFAIQSKGMPTIES